MFKELFDTVWDKLHTPVVVHTLYEDSERVVKFIDKGNGETAEWETEKAYDNFLPAPSLTTVESFVRAMTDCATIEASSRNMCLIHTGSSEVEGILHFDDIDRRSLKMKYVDHPSMAALRLTISKWHTPKEFWRLLQGPLHQCISDSLILMLSSLDMKFTENSNLDIGALGQASGRSTATWKISWKDPRGNAQETELTKDWLYEGPMYACMDPKEHRYEVPLMLEVSKNDLGSPIFRFIERGVLAAEESALADMRDLLETGLKDRAPVYVAE